MVNGELFPSFGGVPDRAGWFLIVNGEFYNELSLKLQSLRAYF